MPKVTHLIVMCDNQGISKKEFPEDINILSFAEVELIGASEENSKFIIICIYISVIIVIIIVSSQIIQLKAILHN